ncbi:aminotransferase class I/II-fold pyridoxal phosphate-dependent enzyme [Populibacterium corticicola]
MTSDPLEAYTLEQLTARRSVKWTQYASDVLPMWVAEMDCSPVPQVIEVIQQIMAAGDTGYPGITYAAEDIRDLPNREVDYRQLPSYQDAYIVFAQDRWGLDVSADQISLMPDVMQGVKYAVDMIGARDLVINTPVYPPFRVYPVEAGARIHEARLADDGRLDFAELEALFESADSYLLCNPQNPTGVAHTREELIRVFELANRHDVRVIVDEIHLPIAATGHSCVPALSVPGSERAIVLFSAAKAFHLAGFKAALMIVGSDAKEELKDVPETVFEGASTIAIAAHTAALVYGGQWLDTVRAGIDARRIRLTEGLARVAPEARVLPAVSTYFAWVDFSRVVVDGKPLGKNPAHFLYRKAKTAFNPGYTFGAGGENYVRINLATSNEVIDEALRRIEEALNR